MTDPSLTDDIVGLSISVAGLAVEITALACTFRARRQRPLHVAALGTVSSERRQRLQRQVRELRVDSPGQIHALRNMALVMRDQSWIYACAPGSVMLAAGTTIQSQGAPWLRDVSGGLAIVALLTVAVLWTRSIRTTRSFLKRFPEPVSDDPIASPVGGPGRNAEPGPGGDLDGSQADA